jgi:hypothetical protein
MSCSIRYIFLLKDANFYYIFSGERKENEIVILPLLEVTNTLHAVYPERSRMGSGLQAS